MANVTVNATISARDAASKNIKTVNKALGNLGKTAGNIGNDFKKVAFGIGAVAAGVGAFTVSAIKDAAADQAATAKLNAALKARGFATASVTAAVERQISAGQLLAFTDDEVRASIEASTRFTKNYAVAQKIQNVAQDLARSTGMDLASATLAVGKAYQGNAGKLLKSLGIEAKALKGQNALNAILAKTKGSAKAYGETLEGSFTAVAISAQELKEKFGHAFLPAVTRLFIGLNPYMARLSSLITKLSPKFERFGNIIVDKILAKLPSLFAEFEANVPKALIGFEQFVTKITDVGKTAESVLGKDGPIRVAITAIGAAFGGLKGAIAANLVKDGMDPFTALIVANIAAQVPASLAAALTGQIVAKAVAAFGTSVAAASVGGAAASTAAGAAGVGGAVAAGAAGVAGASAAAVVGALALPIAIPLALKALGVRSIAQSGLTPQMIAAAQAGQAGTTSASRPAFGSTSNPMTAQYTSNIYIGTGKVDTVVTDTIKRTGSFKRGR